MRTLTALIGLTILAFTNAKKVDVPDSGDMVNLIPNTNDGVAETTFELKAPTGSKMVLFCGFKTISCKVARVMIDDGKRFNQFCPEDSALVYVNSHKNKMTVTIENTGTRALASCQVKATKPYIDMPEKEIDSSEHGLPHLSKKAPSCRCGWTNKPSRRIVNGKEAAINEYPFIVMLTFASSRIPFCGASIITPYHVLTAAHCTDPYLDRKLAVIVGEHDIRTAKETPVTKKYRVTKIYQHKKYDDFDNKHDISILELDTPIQFSDKVGPVCLPTEPRNLQDDYIKVMGWGLTKDKSQGGMASPVLNKVNLRVIDPEVCSVIYDVLTEKPTQICTYNNDKDSCQGDSGGPLVRLNPETNMYEQVALVSYGSECASTNPAVNTDVGVYIPWIKQQIAKSKHKVTLCF